MRRPLEDRFWEKVDRRGPDECWPWMAAKDPRGYGRFQVGRPVGTALAHRVAWSLAHAAAANLHVCHSCDNPSCVNPAHLWLGNDADNLSDMRAKGRGKDVMAEINRSKTHCPRGHEYNEANTYRDAKGRQCKECKKARARDAYRRNPEYHHQYYLACKARIGRS